MKSTKVLERCTTCNGTGDMLGFYPWTKTECDDCGKDKHNFTSHTEWCTKRRIECI